MHRKLTPHFNEKPHTSLKAAHKIKKASGILFLACIYQWHCYASLNRRTKFCPHLYLYKGTRWGDWSSSSIAGGRTHHQVWCTNPGTIRNCRAQVVYTEAADKKNNGQLLLISRAILMWVYWLVQAITTLNHVFQISSLLDWWLVSNRPTSAVHLRGLP